MVKSSFKQFQEQVVYRVGVFALGQQLISPFDERADDELYLIGVKLIFRLFHFAPHLSSRQASTGMRKAKIEEAHRAKQQEQARKAIVADHPKPKQSKPSLWDRLIANIKKFFS